MMHIVQHNSVITLFARLYVMFYSQVDKILAQQHPSTTCKKGGLRPYNYLIEVLYHARKVSGHLFVCL